MLFNAALYSYYQGVKFSRVASDLRCGTSVFRSCTLKHPKHKIPPIVVQDDWSDHRPNLMCHKQSSGITRSRKIFRWMVLCPGPSWEGLHGSPDPLNSGSSDVHSLSTEKNLLTKPSLAWSFNTSDLTLNPLWYQNCLRPASSVCTTM